MPCRFSAMDSARRTFRLPSTPLRLAISSTSLDQPGPRFTRTALLPLSWFKVGSPTP